VPKTSSTFRLFVLIYCSFFAPQVKSFWLVLVGRTVCRTRGGHKGEAKYPPNAQVINAEGKFIIPGLTDSHGYGTWFINDMYLNHGVTAIVDNGLGWRALHLENGDKFSACQLKIKHNLHVDSAVCPRE
jgi:hypothetical protein